MRKPRFFILSFLFLLTIILVRALPGIEKAVWLPKGTAVEKLEEGCLKFTLPDGCIVQVKGFIKSEGQAVITGECGVIGDCVISTVKGKLIALGKKGRIKGGEKPPPGEAEAVDSITLDGAILWLPAVVEFEDARIFDRIALEKMAPPIEK